MAGWLARSTLHVSSYERSIYLYPMGQIDSSMRDTLLEGQVTLKLAKATTVGDISVRLVGNATLRSAQRETRGRVIDLSTTVHRSSDKLEAGEYAFEYTIQVPRTSACSYRPHATYGAIVHKVIATATGAGLFGADLVTELQVYFMSMIMENGASVPGLDILVEDVVDSLGPIRLTWSAPRITASSVFQTELTIANALVDATLVDASLWIAENTEIHHFDKHGKPEAKAVHEPMGPFKVSVLTGTPPHTELHISGPGAVAKQAVSFPVQLRAGQTFKLKNYSRLPMSRLHMSSATSQTAFLRYSTPSQAIQPLRVTHELIFKMTFELGNGSVRQLIVTRPVEIASCLSLDGNLFPPDYTEVFEPPHADTLPRILSASDWGTRESEKCICSLSFEEGLALFKQNQIEETTGHINYKQVNI